MIQKIAVAISALAIAMNVVLGFFMLAQNAELEKRVDELIEARSK